jgi:hypothetical protein
MDTSRGPERRLVRPAALLAALSALGLTFSLMVGTTMAAPNYATVTTHVGHSSDNNHPSTWESEGVDCTDIGVDNGLTHVLADLPDGQAYVQVIVKSGAGESANTVFADPPAAGETVWADTNGNNGFDAGDQEISHIIVCTGAGGDQAEEPADDDASLNIRKIDEDGDRLAGAVFEIEGMEGAFTTDENGVVCIHGLPDDSEWLVTEIQAPAGYELADPASQLVEVDDDGDCNSPDAVFVNTLAQQSASASASVEQSVEASAGGSVEQSVEASVGGSVEGSVLGGTGTPEPSTPDTAMGSGNGPSPLPTIAFAAILLASLAGLAWVNVQAVRTRS